ncbi:MAG: dihydrofolate reductase [Burkholderiaceae bacterium]
MNAPSPSTPTDAGTRPRVTLIAARARNGVIGADDAMPWHIPEELKHFKATTMGQVLVMGRKTFDAIGRPLPGRETIVISRNGDWSHPGCQRADSLEDALDRAAALGRDETFIAGGAQIYALAMPLADRLLITEVDLEPSGDAWFPFVDPGVWEVVARDPRSSAGGTAFAITEYRRR